jgi:hypothetical protein
VCCLSCDAGGTGFKSVAGTCWSEICIASSLRFFIYFVCVWAEPKIRYCTTSAVLAAMHTNCPVGSPPGSRRRGQGCCADWLTAPLVPQIRPQPGVSQSGPRLQLTILCPIKHAQCTLSVVSQSPSECLPAALLNSLSSVKYVLTGHVTWTLFPKSIFMADIYFPESLLWISWLDGLVGM